MNIKENVYGKINKKKPYIKDIAINSILSDEYCRKFVVTLMSKSLDLDADFIEHNLRLISNKVNFSNDSKTSIVDNVYENNESVINVEVNLVRSPYNINKNNRYVYNLYLNQARISDKDNYKYVRQINLDYFDYFKAGKFMYNVRSMETNLLIVDEYDKLEKIHINLEYLRKICYTDIANEPEDSLKKILYFLVCDDKDKLNKLYGSSDIMANVEKKLENLRKALKEDLYYNREEFINKISEDVGREEKAFEIAKNLINLGMNDNDIMTATGLSLEDINSLKESN